MGNRATHGSLSLLLLSLLLIAELREITLIANVLRFCELGWSCFLEIDTILLECLRLLLVASESALLVLIRFLFGLGLSSTSVQRLSTTQGPIEPLALLRLLGSLLCPLLLLDVLDLARANIDLPAGFLLLGAGLVVSIPCRGSLNGFLLLLVLLLLLLSPLLLLSLLLCLLLLLLALLLLEERV